MSVKMNPEWKRKWIEALRSGEFEQGDGQLLTTVYDDADLPIAEEFCCLGVLSQLVDPDRARWKANDESLTGPICEMVGLVHDDGVYIHDPIIDPTAGHGFASSLNDNGVSFSEIADLIEKNL